MIDPFQKFRTGRILIVAELAYPVYQIGQDRYYHNYSHAFEVLTALNQLTEFETTPAQMLAAIWHDAVYYPGAGSDANERCSSMALGQAAQKVNTEWPLSDDEKHAVNRAQDLIEQTSIDVHMQATYAMTAQLELSQLLDADLSGLAKPWDEFVDRQCAIIRENRGDPNDPKALETSAKFLSNFLSKYRRQRKSIYRTARGIALWEAAATENIERWVQQNVKEDLQKDNS